MTMLYRLIQRFRRWHQEGVETSRRAGAAADAEELARRQERR